MEKRNLINFVASWFIILLGAIVLVLPIFNITNIRLIFIVMITIYGLVNVIKNLVLLEFKEYSSFSKGISCILILLALLFVDINDSPWNLALLLFIWVILMSLTKLKEADYYHDRKNKLWLFNIVCLIVFILTGILATINLYCAGDIQILILGFFFVIIGILDVMEPLVNHLLGKK